MKSYETLTKLSPTNTKRRMYLKNTVSTTVATVPHRCSKPVKMQM